MDNCSKYKKFTLILNEFKVIWKNCYIELIFYEIIAKIVTIMIEDDLDKKVRLLQAKAIQSTYSSVRFSSTVNEILRKYLK